MLFLSILTACLRNKDGYKEQLQTTSEEKVNVSQQIVDIKTDLVLSPNLALYLIDNILIVLDTRSNDRGIHLFERESLKYLTSTGKTGRGPGEIVRYGHIIPRPDKNSFWISDYGKMVFWEFTIDSILFSENYLPLKVLPMENDFFLTRANFLNDSSILGKAASVKTTNSFEEVMITFSLNSLKSEKFGYTHPLAVGRESISSFKLSPNGEFYANAYMYIDLLSICETDGSLRKNIFGPEWKKTSDRRRSYFSQVDIADNKIFAGYNGGYSLTLNEYERIESNFPSNLIVFNSFGDYLKTFEIEHPFFQFCVDPKYNRIIFCFNTRDTPLGYISIKNL